MGDLEADLQRNEDRAREKSVYKGAAGGQDIAAQAADLEAQGLGSAIAAQNAGGGGSVCSSGPAAEDRRTVIDEANKVMH